jgi:hypothetical protein
VILYTFVVAIRKAMEEDLSQLGAGVYVDKEGTLYLKMREFLAAHQLEDRPEVRRAVLDEVRLQFGNVPLREME